MTDRLAELLRAVVNSSHNQYIQDIAMLVYRICSGEQQRFGGSELFRYVSQPNERTLPAVANELRDTYVDKRLLDLSVLNFRAFSYLGDQKACGIKLHRANYPMSLFMVGSNGSGKSSLYSAMEILYTDQIATKDVLRISEDDNYEVHDFGKNTEANKEDSVICARLADQTELKINMSDRDNQAICPPSAFCSDYDVEQVALHKQDLTPFFLSQIGYKSIYEFLSYKLDDCIAELSTMASNRQPELEKYRSIGYSKFELKTIYATLLSLSQGYWRTLDFSYFINTCNAIVVLVDTTETQINSLASGDRENAVSQFISIISSLTEKFDELRKAQTNISVYYTFSSLWNNLLESVGKESYRLSDEMAVIANDFLASDRPLAIAQDVKEQALQLQRILLSTDRYYQSFKDDIEKWPDIEAELLTQLVRLQNYEESEEPVDQYINKVMELKESVIEFKELLSNKIAEVMNELIDSQSKNINQSLKWFSEKGERIQIEKAPETGHPIVTIKYNRGEEEIVTYPSLYLNTFRFRLFVISLKIALTFAFMQREKTIVPIVIDEVFNSSDFENRLRLEKYVEMIYRQYDDMQVSLSRLQIVLFTHDEIVLRSFARGANLKKEFYINNPIKRDYISGRIFRQNEASKFSTSPETLGDMVYYNLYKDIAV